MSNVFHRGSRAPFQEMMRLETMLPSWVRQSGRYGLALLFVAAAALLRWVWPEVLGSTPFLAFYLAWVGAAAFGGLGPGLLATATSWLCLEVLFDFTPGETVFSDVHELGRFVVLLAGGLTVSLVAERMRRGRISEREQARALASAKQALERERDILQAVMDGAKNSHLVYLDRDFHFVQVNATYAQTCGYRPEQMIGKNHFALYPHAENEAIFARVRDTGEPFEVHDKPFEFPDQPQRGVTYWDWTLTPIKDPAGRVEGLVFSLHETTERKRAQEAMQQANEQLQLQAEELQTQGEELQTQTEELRMQTEELARANAALRESEKRERQRAEELATFLEAAPTPVIIVHDPSGVHMTGNRAADELLRHPRGAEISLSAPPETRPRHFKAVKDGRELRPDELPAERAARGEQVRDFEFSLVFDDGTTRHLLGYGTPLRDENGRPRGAVHILVDITERRRAEEMLRVWNAMLESKVAERTAQLQHRAGQLQKLTLELSQTEDRERKRMAEILHDDVQQIIAAAKFHLSLLRNRVKDDASLQAIGSQIDQMLKDAIEKSRGLSHELSPAILYQGDFTETLGWLASQMQAKHGLVVHVHTQGPVVLQSEALRSFLYKTAQELLFNVVKHARVKEAGIRVRRCGPYVCLSVSDRGRGFDPQGLRQAAGFGLLSIRERIELLGGRMKIKSARSQGSTFFIVVPDAERQKKAESEEGKKVGGPLSPSDVLTFAPSSSPGVPRLRVLLADDHRIVREGLRLLLSDEYDIEIVGEAAHGREAVDLALRLAPEVVIMDVAMPLIDGDEATRQIKRHLPETRIIALSTYNEPETREKMYRAGAESYVLKTASAEELLAAIRGKESGPS